MNEWQPIETVPKDRPILIRDMQHQPELVTWQERRPEEIIGNTRYFEVPAGWFRLHGSRSHVIHPTEWLDIPK